MWLSPLSSFAIPSACVIHLVVNEKGRLYLDHIHHFFKTLILGDEVTAADYVSHCDLDVKYIKDYLLNYLGVIRRSGEA